MKFSGSGSIRFHPLSLRDANGHVVFDFRDLSLPWNAVLRAAAEKRLREKGISGRLVTLSVVTDPTHSSGDIPLKVAGTATPVLDLEVPFPTAQSFGKDFLLEMHFTVPPGQHDTSWYLLVENHIPYTLVYRLEAYGPSNLERISRTIDLDRINGIVANVLAPLSISLDSETGGSITVAGNGLGKIDFSAMTAMGITVIDVNSTETDVELILDSASPSGLSMRVTSAFESEGFEGKLQFGWSHNVDMDGLNIVIALPLKFDPLLRTDQKGRATFDGPTVKVDVNFSYLDIHSMIDPPEDSVKSNISSALKAIINANVAVFDALIAIVLVAAGLPPSDTQVISAAQDQDHIAKLDVVTRRTVP